MANHGVAAVPEAQQVLMEAPAKVGGTLWNWEKLWKECGFTSPR